MSIFTGERKSTGPKTAQELADQQAKLKEQLQKEGAFANALANHDPNVVRVHLQGLEPDPSA